MSLVGLELAYGSFSFSFFLLGLELAHESISFMLSLKDVEVGCESILITLAMAILCCLLLTLISIENIRNVIHCFE